MLITDGIPSSEDDVFQEHNQPHKVPMMMMRMMRIMRMRMLSCGDGNGDDEGDENVNDIVGGDDYGVN